MLPKAYLTSHSRMSGSRSVITSLWLSGSWRSFLVQFFCVFLPPLLNVFCFCQVHTISVLYWAHLCMKCSFDIVKFKNKIKLKKKKKEKTLILGKIEGWRRRGQQRVRWLDGCEFWKILGVGDGPWGLACCSSWSCKELDTTERLNWTELNWKQEE